MSNLPDFTDGLTRRTFLMTTAAATAGMSVSLMGSGNYAYAAGSDLLRVGVIGCGGRGSGAARDAVVSAEGVEIYAMGDLFEDRLDRSRNALLENIPDAMNVDESRCFTGFDNYLNVIDAGVDIIILAAPPGFRPLHFKAAVDAGKHVFMEKPVAVDLTGIRSILSSGETATQKGLSVVAGTLYRRQLNFVEGVRRVHEGMIGKIVSAQEYYLTGPIWLRERKPGMSDMEWQCRNWYYFTWLSGDHIVEQFVHNLDVINWVMQSPPERCLGIGGRLVRVDPSYGHIYDHFSVEYEYPGGVRVEAKCRQMEGCTTRVENRIIGTDGIADINPNGTVIRSHTGETLFEYKERGNNGYVQEHTDLINSIREGKPINETHQIAVSTLTAIFGRESAYTGQMLTWDEIKKADIELVPDSFAFGSMPFPEVPLPGSRTLKFLTETRR